MSGPSETIIQSPDALGTRKRQFTADEVATMLDVNVRTVYNMADRGELPHVRAGRSYRFYRSHLLDYAGSEEVLEDMLATLESESE